MDLRFGFVAIFLILDIIFVWPTNSKSSGNQGPKKKKNSTKVELSSGIATNPFLQRTTTLPSVGNNPFLIPVRLPDTSLPHENKSSKIEIFINADNPFLNPGHDTKFDPNTPAPQLSYRPTPYPNRPAPVDDPFIPSYTQNPPIKLEPPTSGIPSLPDSEIIKIGLTKTKSELKCDEYVGEIMGITEITSLVGTSSDVIKMTNVCRNANRLVIGGTEATTGEFPHMVALGRLDSNMFILMCGATLISHTWVLSAAHCTYGPNGSPSVARIGFHRLTDQSNVGIPIQTMIRHPQYNPPAMYADIALVKLEKAVTFSVSVRPACLYQLYDTVPTSAWISGWGATEFAGDASDRLQKAQLDLVDQLTCTLQYNSSKEIPHGVTPSMICAGDPRGDWTRDSCQGDSGGPLQVIHPKNLCLFQVIGITSFGQGCAIINSPGVYTRVSHYLPWIENIVWQGQ